MTPFGGEKRIKSFVQNRFGQTDIKAPRKITIGGLFCFISSSGVPRSTRFVHERVRPIPPQREVGRDSLWGTKNNRRKRLFLVFDDAPKTADGTYY
jgi:hypothetical protein